jgi:hypothetical protein
MHCGADLADEGPDAADVTDADDYDTGLDDATGRPDSRDATGSAATSRSASTGGRLLDPDGLLDNSATVVVGIGGGLFVGFLSLIVLGVSLGGAGVALALVAWLGSTAVLVRQRTVFGAIQYGAYAVALALVALPLAVLVADDSPLVDRLVGALLFEVVVGVVALVIAAVGYLAGRADVG